jgi:hypothetical protein
MLWTPIVAVLEMFRVAVMVVEFTTVNVPVASVTPPPSPVNPVALVRFVPVMVTGTANVPVAGCVAEFGLIDVIVAPRTVKGTALLAAAAPTTVTVTFLEVRAAPAVMVKVAVIDVELATVTPLMVMPPPETATVVSPTLKLVPVSVTGTAVPRRPVAGLIEANVGVGGIVTVKVTALLTPPGAVTVTFRAVPAAPAVKVKVVLTCVSPTTVMGPTVIPPPDTVTAVAPVNPLPERLTGIAPSPRIPDAGAIDVSTGPRTV